MKTPIIKIVSFGGKRVGRGPVWKPLFYFRLVAENSEIVAQSEGYTTKAKRDKTARLLAKAKLVVA